MQTICVAFVVGNDIVNKIKALPTDSVMDFILGRIDDDYFGKRFVDIEELDHHWEPIFSYLENRKGIDVLKNRTTLNEEKNRCIVFVENINYMQILYTALHSWNPISIGEDYVEFLSFCKWEEKACSFYTFVYYIEVLKSLCEKAIQINGTILFSLEYQSQRVFA